jgi:hypothetical protein
VTLAAIANEIIIHREQRNRMCVVFDLFREAICQPGKAAAVHPTEQGLRVAKMKLVSDLIGFWLYLYLWLVVPGTLVGWPLHRYWRSTLVAALVAEAFSLLPWFEDTMRFGFSIYQLAATHFLLLVPVLMAIFTGYYGSRCIENKATERRNNIGAPPN